MSAIEKAEPRWARLRERIIATDPDWTRSQMAARASGAPALATFVLWLVSLRDSLPTPNFILGGAMAMMSILSVSDKDLRDQKITHGLLVIPILCMLALGSAVGSHFALRLLVLSLVVFFAVWAQRFGQRGTGLGNISFQAAFFSFFVHADLNDFPALATSALTGLACGYLVRFLLLPDNPNALLQRSFRAVPLTISRLLDALVDAIAEPSARNTRRVRDALTLVNERALALEDLLALHPSSAFRYSRTALRTQIFHLEIAAERLVAGVRDILSSPEGTPHLEALIRQALIQARLAMLGDEAAAQHARLLIQEAISFTHGEHGAPRQDKPDLRLLFQRFSGILEDFFRTSKLAFVMRDARDSLSGVHPLQNENSAPEKSESSEESSIPTHAAKELHPSTRLAIQTAIATCVSGLFGSWISNDRWMWAVVASYVVVSRAQTRGDILLRAWQRILGTALGVLFGILLASWIEGIFPLEVGAIFVCIFIGIFSLRNDYSAMVFWFTAVVAILYNLLGHFSSHLLYLRIVETVAGATIGAVTAVLVLPTRTGGKVREELVEVLRSVANNLLLDAQSDSSANASAMQARARELDEQLRNLRKSAEPFTRSIFRISQDTVQLVHSASTLVFYVRQLAFPSLMHSALSSSHEALVPIAKELASQAQLLALRLGSKNDPLKNEQDDFRSQLSLLKQIREVSEVEYKNQVPTPLLLALQWLSRIDRTIQAMAVQLKAKGKSEDAAILNAPISLIPKSIRGSSGQSFF